MVRVAEAWQVERMAVDENGKGLERPKKVKGIKQGSNTIWFTVLKSSLWL